MPIREKLESQARRQVGAAREQAEADPDVVEAASADAEALLADLANGRMTTRVLDAIRELAGDRAG